MMMNEDFETRIVCTGKDQHPSRELRVITYCVDGGEAFGHWVRRCAELGWEGLKFPRLLAYGSRTARNSRTVLQRDVAGVSIEDAQEHMDLRQKNLWRFQCPTCKRDKQIKAETLEASLLKLHQAGVSKVDISRL